MNKGNPGRKPKLAGLSELDFTTAEGDTPHVYFAGIAKLPVSWIMEPVIAFAKASDASGKGKSGGGKKGGGGGAKDYFGHAAGVICGCNLDFIWGKIVDNELVWPSAKEWDSHIYKKNTTVIFTDGNVWRTPEKTPNDPGVAPWTLYAIPWVAGSYTPGTRKLYNGNVWEVVNANAVVAPPADPPDPKINVQSYTPVNNWIFLCTPQLWSVGDVFWPADSIVADLGRLYYTANDTKNRPPAAPWVLFKQDLGGTNPLKITVEDSGDTFTYDGRPDQELDPSDEAILTALGHPPFRNKAVEVLKNYRFGPSRTSPPEVVILGGRKPVQSLIVGDATDFDDDWQVNPWCVLAEFLTHPVFGLGLSLTMFDAPSWQAEADRCAANPELFYISPMYTDLKKIREIVADLLSYVDGFTYWSAAALLMAGHWPHGEAAPAFTAATTIDRNDLAAGSYPSSKSDGWGGTNDSVAVSFRDVQAGFESRPVTAPNLSSRRIVRRMQSERIDRPHIVRSRQAMAWAMEFAKIVGKRTNSGTETVRAEKAASIVPGSLFLFNDDDLQMADVRRCLRKTISAPPLGTVKIGWEKERGASPQSYTPTPTNPVPDAGPPPAALLNYAAAQLPASLAGEANTLAILAGRMNDVTSSFEVWLKESDDTAFQLLGTNHAFAVAGTLYASTGSEVAEPGGSTTQSEDVGYITQGDTYNLATKDFWKHQLFYYTSPAVPFPFDVGVEGVDYTIDPDAGTITILDGGGIATGKYVHVKFWTGILIVYDPATPQSDVDAISAPLTDDEINDGSTLIFAFQAANPALYEILRVKSVVVADTGMLLLRVRRAGFGTLLGGDGAYEPGTDGNDPVFVVKKSGITPLKHVNFPFYHANSSAINLRLTPSSAWVHGDPADLYDPASNPEGLTTAFSYTWNNLYAPQVEWLILQQNGADITDFTGSFASTDVFTFAFEMRDLNGDLVAASLIASQGQQEITLWSNNFEPSAVQNKTVEFSLPKGNWDLTASMLDVSANQSSQQLSYGGDPAMLYIDAATAPAPLIWGKNKINGYICNLFFGELPNGDTVKYQLQDRGVAWDAGDWVVAPPWNVAGTVYGSVPPFRSGTKTLYAYVHETGKTDSAVVHWNL